MSYVMGVWNLGHGDVRPSAECFGYSVPQAAVRLLKDGTRAEHSVPLQKGLDRRTVQREVALGDGRL